MTTELTEAQKNRLDQVLAMLGEFSNLRSDMPVGMIRVLIYIALHEGAGVADIASALGMQTGTVTKSLSDWTEYDRHKQPSFNFIEGVKNWQDKRTVKNFFTAGGRKFVRTVLKKLNV